MLSPFMSIFFVLTALIAGAISGGTLGYARGAGNERAKQNAQSVVALTNIIEASNNLIVESNSASQSMRLALTLRATHDTKTTREIKNALAKNAGSRVDCRFDDGVMRNLAEARSRAAAVAASGVRNTVSGPGATGE